MINRFTLIFSFLLLSLFSCKKDNYPHYEKVNDGLYYKILRFENSDSKPKLGDILTLEFVWDYKKSPKLNVPLANKLNGTKVVEMNGLSIFKIFEKLNKGDSIQIIMSVQEFANNFNPGNNFDITLVPDTIRFNAVLRDFDSAENYEKKKIHFEEWLKSINETEKSLIDIFLSEHEVAQMPDEEGMYFIEIEEGKGNFPQVGNNVFVHYRGYFLDGYEFDNTYTANQPLDVIYGLSGQVIKGFEKALSKMKVGAKAQIILPSRLAFGERGSTTGIVPPNTPVVYELELIKIK